MRYVWGLGCNWLLSVALLYGTVGFADRLDSFWGFDCRHGVWWKCGGFFWAVWSIYFGGNLGPAEGF